MSERKPVGYLFLFAAALTITACSIRVVRGSGSVISETRQVSNFDSIDLSGSGEVIVTQGGVESLSIETDANIMQYIKAEVKGGTLELGLKDGTGFIQPTTLVFYVGVDDLTGLTISGSGDLEVDELETSRMNATVSGSGDVQLRLLNAAEVRASISGSGEIILDGDVDVQDILISGSGQYLASDVCSETVKISISGSGDATVCAADSLETHISGSGSVSYYGRPSISSTGSGSGTVHSLGEK